MDTATRDAIDGALFELFSLLGCNGWTTALRLNDPGNVTEWAGPRIYSAIDRLTRILPS